MTTTILVTLPSGEAKEFSVDKEVFRIGSMAGSELVIHGIAPHALTVQKRSDHCMVFNRSRHHVWVSDRQVAPFEAVESFEGQAIRLPEGVVLTLDPKGVVRNNDAGVRRQAPLAQNPKPTATTTNGKDRKTQIAIISVCLLGILLLSFEGSGGHPSARDVSAQFDRLVRELQWSDKGDPRLSLTIARTLQSARRFELRGDREATVREYGRIRDVLLGRRRADGSFSTELETKAFEFVRERLRQNDGR